MSLARQKGARRGPILLQRPEHQDIVPTWPGLRAWQRFPQRFPASAPHLGLSRPLHTHALANFAAHTHVMPNAGAHTDSGRRRRHAGHADNYRQPRPRHPDNQGHAMPTTKGEKAARHADSNLSSRFLVQAW